jgi:CRP-like cAMP-binding protein
LSVVERLAILTQAEILRGVGVQALADLAGAAREVVLTPGESLFSRASPHESLYFVVQGEILATRTAPDVTRKYGELELVGGAAALTERIRQWEVNAIGPARVIAVPIEAWFDRMELHFDLVLSTLGILGRERESILEQLAALSGPSGLVLT